MGISTAVSVIPSKLKPAGFVDQHHPRTRCKKKNHSLFPVSLLLSWLIIWFSEIMMGVVINQVARLFGPAIFEASKLKVLFLGVDEKKKQLPRTYTLTHSDITSKLTLAISHTINNSQLQGWYNRFQRDEVVAEWKKIKGEMSLHVHCHISGGHSLLDLFAKLRYYIFSKELPVVLKAFVHGDVNLINNHPELQTALVWVYFHSNIPEFNKVECWGPLNGAIHRTHDLLQHQPGTNAGSLQPCAKDCNCCFPPFSLIPMEAVDGS